MLKRMIGHGRPQYAAGPLKEIGHSGGCVPISTNLHRSCNDLPVFSGQVSSCLAIFGSDALQKMRNINFIF
jgi:hypothetical protein